MNDCIWLDEIESFPPYCITHRCGETAPCQKDDCPHCAGRLRREKIARDPRFVERVREARAFYEERGIATLS